MEDRGEYRTMHVAILDTDEFQNLSRNARLALHTLKLELGRAGIGVIYPGRLEFSTGCTSHEIKSALDELANEKWIEREKYVIWLRNGLRYERGQNLANPNHVKGIISCVLRLPKLEIVQRWFAYYRIVVQGVNTEADVKARWKQLVSEYNHTDPYEVLAEPSDDKMGIVPFDEEEIGYDADESGEHRPEPEKPKKQPAYSQDDMGCAVLLRDELARVSPGYVERAKINLDAWADQFRLIRNIDRRPLHDTLYILKNFVREPFWSQTIKSPNLLRGKTQKGKGEDRYMKILSDVSKCITGTQDGKKQIPPEYTAVLASITDTDRRRSKAAQLLGRLADFDLTGIGL